MSGATVAEEKSYAEARSEWLAAHRDLWFPLAQLLVSTIDVDAKTAPRSIRGLKLNDSERKYVADFHAHVRRALGRVAA